MTKVLKIPKPKKQWGQNHLLDHGMLLKLIRTIRAREVDNFLEIGPGSGTLTRRLAPRVGSLAAIEIDPRFKDHLDHVQSENPNFKYVIADFLDYELPPGTRDIRIAGNIPYNITSQIIVRLFLMRKRIKDAHLLMQKEVAQRIVASPGTKEYGILSVYADLFCDAEYMFEVSRNVFRPIPNVDSAVLRMDFDNPAQMTPMEEKRLRIVVRAAFNQRRKTLRNSLKYVLGTQVEIPTWVDLNRRAEELAPHDFLRLANQLKGIQV